MVTPPAKGGIVLGPRLGAGGMAAVHLARLSRAAGFVRPVAVKVVHPHLAEDLELVQMFLEEARLVARVRHANVVAPIDLMVSDGQVMMVMEYVHGVTASELMKTLAAGGAVVPPRIAATIVGGVLEGLHAAHEVRGPGGDPLKVVHRDVSPQNVMIGATGEVKVLDFGVAKLAGRASTRTGRVKGKIAYMAPEQLRGKPIDRRADVYGAAVVLWELVTGRRLFDAESEGHLCTLVMEGSVTAPSAIVPGLPAALDAIVARGLAKTPEQRFGTAREMAIALEETLGFVSPRALGEWLSAVCRESLARREALLASLEHGGGAAEGLPAEGTSTLPTAAIVPMAVRPHAGAPGRKARVPRWSLLAAGAVVVVAVAVAGVLAGRVAQQPPGLPERTSREAAAPTSAAGSATPQRAAAPEPAAPQAPAEATARPLPPAAATPRAPLPRPEPRRAAAGRARRDCDQPYYFRDGIKIFRPECL